jgi:hypothetical protein
MEIIEKELLEKFEILRNIIKQNNEKVIRTDITSISIRILREDDHIPKPCIICKDKDAMIIDIIPINNVEDLNKDIDHIIGIKLER